MLDPVMVNTQAGQCGRCRGEVGVAGRVCQHCRLDEQFVGWEVRIYSLQTHAMAAGQAVTAEEAIIRVSPLFALPTVSASSDQVISHLGRGWRGGGKGVNQPVGAQTSWKVCEWNGNPLHLMVLVSSSLRHL